MEQARNRQRQFADQERARQRKAADKARELINQAIPSLHPYLDRKGFPALPGLTLDGILVIPVMDFNRYPEVISAQLISNEGDKKFIPGGRVKAGVYRLGVAPSKARRVVLCEGYATGLSLDAALRLLPGPHCVLVCFSAKNLELVSTLVTVDALIAADNDASRTGEESAKRTGRRWFMPSEIGTDWNDVHVKHGLRAVMEAIRAA